MKTLKRVIAVSLVATFAMVAFAIPAPADHTEARLTLEIDPDVGPVGQTINAQLPAEAFDPAAGDECAASSSVNQVLAQAFADFASGLEPTEVLENIAANILEEVVAGPEFAGTLESILFPLVFADVATQEPLSDPSFWDPDTGQGSIVAPGTDVNTGEPLARPAIYAVAATCLGINEDLVPDAVAAAVASLVDILDDQTTEVSTLLACLTAAGADPTAIAACITTFVEAVGTAVEDAVPGILETLLLAVINQDPDVAWAALYCLTGDNFETCDVPAAPLAPAEPVAAVARFTG